MRTTLESGGWVEHLPIQDVKGKHIRAYRRAISLHVPGNAVDDDGDVDRRVLVTSLDLGERREARGDAVAAIILTAWSFPEPVPDLEGYSVVNGESLGELPADDLIEIERILEPFAAKFDDKPNPKEATTSISNGSSRARAGSSRRD